MEDRQDNNVGFPVRFPGTLSLRDLITVVSVAVSLTIAWGVFSTRITIMEREIATLAADRAKLTLSMEEQARRITRFEMRQYDNEGMIDRLYEYNSKIPQPKRRTQ